MLLSKQADKLFGTIKSVSNNKINTKLIFLKQFKSNHKANFNNKRVVTAVYSSILFI